ncbi:MAG: methyltransferase domain-containing protein [Pyrinomonadaceae bacterium]
MFDRFKHRSYELERLDTGDYTTAQYNRWHREMWFVHRIFGEVRALRRSLFKTIQDSDKSSVSILDVGAGSGGMLIEIGNWLKDRKALLVGAELNTEATVEMHRSKIKTVQCDATGLPFADGSFDFVFCTLFLHHLGDEPAVELLEEMSRVAANRIFVIDLNRHPTAYYFYKFIAGVFFQKFTRDDGALSILRSFNPKEMLELAKKAGLVDVKVERSRVNRLILSGRHHKYE